MTTLGVMLQKRLNSNLKNEFLASMKNTFGMESINFQKYGKIL